MRPGYDLFTLFTMSEQRERILAAACDLYLSTGLDGFSMRKLARSLGVTAPALYRHYESKERLLQDVMAQAYERFAQYLYRSLAGSSPVERLQLAADAYVDFALEHPMLYDMLFASPEFRGVGEVSAELEALGCAVGQFWHDRVRECMDHGILREGEPEAVSVTMWGHAHGLLVLHRQGVLARDGIVTDEDFRALFRASGRRVLVGLAPSEQAAALVARDDASGVVEAVRGAHEMSGATD